MMNFAIGLLIFGMGPFIYCLKKKGVDMEVQWEYNKPGVICGWLMFGFNFCVNPLGALVAGFVVWLMVYLFSQTF